MKHSDSLAAYLTRNERAAIRRAAYARNVAFYRASMANHEALDHDPRNYLGPVMLAQAVRALSLRVPS